MFLMYSWDAWCSLLIPVLGFCYGFHKKKSKGLPMEKLLSFILIVSSVALFIAVLLLKFIFWESEEEYFGIYAVPLGAFGFSGFFLAVADLFRSLENKTGS